MLPSFRHVKDVLPNGLRVVTVELPHLHSAALVVYAKVGSRYEPAEDNGLSHFLEHMLFRGTRTYPDSYQLNYAIEELGGTLYAETGRDYSLYQITVDPELLDRGLAILGEIFDSPAFTAIDLERQIILEEINEDLDEDGKDINLDDLGRRTAFPGHGLGQKITGPADNVSRFSDDDVRRHFARFYGASNLILCVSGPVSSGAVVAAATRAFGGLPAGEPARTVAPVALEGGPGFAYVENPSAQTGIQILFRALPEADPHYVALMALTRVLDDGMSTRLHYTLCDQAGLAYYVNANVEPYHDTALFEVDGAAAHGKVGPLVRRIFELLRSFRDEDVSDRELAKAKRRYRYDLGLAFDDVDAMAGWFGGSELFHAPIGYDAKVARMEKITAADVRAAAEKVFCPERLIVVASGGMTDRQLRDLEKIVRDPRLGA